MTDVNLCDHFAWNNEIVEHMFAHWPHRRHTTHPQAIHRYGLRHGRRIKKRATYLLIQNQTHEINVFNSRKLIPFTSLRAPLGFSQTKYRNTHTLYFSLFRASCRLFYKQSTKNMQWFLNAQITFERELKEKKNDCCQMRASVWCATNSCWP